MGSGCMHPRWSKAKYKPPIPVPVPLPSLRFPSSSSSQAPMAAFCSTQFWDLLGGLAACCCVECPRECPGSVVIYPPCVRLSPNTLCVKRVAKRQLPCTHSRRHVHRKATWCTKSTFWALLTFTTTAPPLESLKLNISALGGCMSMDSHIVHIVECTAYDMSVCHTKMVRCHLQHRSHKVPAEQGTTTTESLLNSTIPPKSNFPSDNPRFFCLCLSLSPSPGCFWRLSAGDTRQLRVLQIEWAF